MFETNTSKGFSTSQQQRTFDSSSTFENSPLSYGLEAKQEKLTDIENMGGAGKRSALFITSVHQQLGGGLWPSFLDQRDCFF